MGMFGDLVKRVTRPKADPTLPPLPQPKAGYALVTADMMHFDLIDGEEECGGVELHEGGGGAPSSWKVHVYGVDATFPSLGKARAWLGKPDITMEPTG